jgi:hypothetical protein
VRVNHWKGIDQTEIENKLFGKYREWSTGGEYEEMDVKKNETDG